MKMCKKPIIYDLWETNENITYIYISTAYIYIILGKLQCLEINEGLLTFQMDLVSTNVDSKVTDDAEIPWNVMFELLHAINMQSAHQCRFIQGHCTD